MVPTDTAAVGASPTAADGVVANKMVQVANGNLPVWPASHAYRQQANVVVARLVAHARPPTFGTPTRWR